MATRPHATNAVAPANSSSSSLPLLCLAAGWFIPGGGHFLLRKPVRGALLLFAIIGMFATGIGLKGKIYSPGTGELLDILAFVAQLGSGLTFIVAKLGGWGAASVQTAVADYGKAFLIVAGLLNIVAAVDAHSLASGRKAS